MTGNIGEWSELYTLFKLLADGKLYAADADTNKIPEIYYDVLKVIRSQSNGALEYCRDAEIKVINAETGDVICSVPISSFIEQTDKLLAGIKDKKGSKGAFELPEVWSFANSVKCQTLKAKSQDKADIHIMVHDIMSGRDDTFGFSIKSQLGSPSTLFNASGATNFTYKLTGHKLTESEIQTFHDFKYFKEKFDYLSSLGTSIGFVKTDAYRHILSRHQYQKPIQQIKIRIRRRGRKNNERHIHIGDCRADQRIVSGQYTTDITLFFLFIDHIDFYQIAHQRLDPLLAEDPFCFTFINSGSYYVNVVKSGNSF